MRSEHPYETIDKQDSKNTVEADIIKIFYHVFSYTWQNKARCPSVRTFEKTITRLKAAADLSRTSSRSTGDESSPLYMDHAL